MASDALVATPRYNREAWLWQLTDTFLYDHFEDAGYPIPAVTIGIGLPSKAAFSRKKRRIGECWTPQASAESCSQIWISPTLADPVEIADVLIHELCHACTPGEGHGKAFKRCGEAVGLTGKPTVMHADDALLEQIKAWLEKLPDLPHVKLKPETTKKQSARLIKVECESCGCIVRMSQKCIEEAGLPTCGCGGWMDPAPPKPKTGRGA